MLENLFEEEGLAGLSGSGDQNSGGVTATDHDSVRIVILIGLEIGIDKVSELAKCTEFI